MKHSNWVWVIGTMLSGSCLSAESLASLGPAAALQAAPQLVVATPEPSAAVTSTLAVLGVAFIAWRLRSRMAA